jgi:hypothetical protein
VRTTFKNHCLSNIILTAPSPNPTLSEAGVEVHLVPEGISEVFQARCTFNASNAGGVRFNVSWYFDGVFDSSYSTTLENIHGTYIYLNRNNFITLGRNVSTCMYDIFHLKALLPHSEPF